MSLQAESRWQLWLLVPHQQQHAGGGDGVHLRLFSCKRVHLLMFRHIWSQEACGWVMFITTCILLSTGGNHSRVRVQTPPYTVTPLTYFQWEGMQEAMLVIMAKKCTGTGFRPICGIDDHGTDHHAIQ